MCAWERERGRKSAHLGRAQKISTSSHHYFFKEILPILYLFLNLYIGLINFLLFFFCPCKYIFLSFYIYFFFSINNFYFEIKRIYRKVHRTQKWRSTHWKCIIPRLKWRKERREASAATMATPLFHPRPNHLLTKCSHHPEFYGNYLIYINFFYSSISVTILDVGYL